MRMDVITLVGAQDPRGVFDTRTETTNIVPCGVRSATRSEVYQAKAVGMNPSIVFELAIAEEYDGQQKIIFHNKEYRVIRTYQKDFGIEIVCEVATYDKN